MCLDEFGRAPGLVLCNFTCLTHLMYANDVCDILLHYYNTSCKVQTLYYNATILQYDVSVIGSESEGRLRLARGL